MTFKQHYFPYFFDQSQLNKSLEKFGLTTKIVINRRSKMAEKLIIIEKQKFNFLRKEKELLQIPFWTTLMVVDEELIYWNTEEDYVNIVKINLTELRIDLVSQNSKIDISNMDLGNNIYQTYLGLNNFVTFVRKSDLKYNQEYFENFVIMIINETQINLIPFDDFNKKGGDYGYVWPATAAIDVDNKKLYGKGMRMNDFEVKLGQDYS